MLKKDTKKELKPYSLKEYDEIEKPRNPHISSGSKKDELNLAKQLFVQKTDGKFHYQYNKASRFMSYAVGIKIFQGKLYEAHGDNMKAAENYNGQGDKEYVKKLFYAMNNSSSDDGAWERDYAREFHED